MLVQQQTLSNQRIHTMIAKRPAAKFVDRGRRNRIPSAGDKVRKHARKNIVHAATSDKEFSEKLNAQVKCAKTQAASTAGCVAPSRWRTPVELAGVHEPQLNGIEDAVVCFGLSYSAGIYWARGQLILLVFSHPIGDEPTPGSL